MSGRTAVVLGATGLVGSALWPRLLHDGGPWDRVILLTRKPLEALPEGVSCRVLDFESLPEGLPEDLRAHDFFCCFGTTIRQAGSRRAFTRVDHDYVVRIAEALVQRGLEHALVVTAMGSDPDSIIFYNRVKGRIEADLSALNIPLIHFFRPSLLLGNRGDSRPLETLGQSLAGPVRSVMKGPLSSWAPIPAAEVAQAMCRTAVKETQQGEPRTGERRIILSSDQIARIARESL